MLRVAGSAYADSLKGGAGDDWFQGTWGNDTIIGAGGTNTLDYGTVGGAVRVMLSSDGAGTAIKVRGSDVFANIGIIQGSYGADHLQGWAGATKTVYLRGGVGADTIDGAGNVNNVADYAGSSKVTIDLAHSVVTGAIGPDTLVNVVAVRGSYGSDTIKGADNGDFSIDGGGDRAGLDTLDYSGLSGPVTVIYGRASVSGPLAGTVSKSGGNDTFVNVAQILGTSGDDDLVGTPDPTAASAIRLHGEAGNDYIDGARSTANVADYTDSPGAVVVHLQDYVSGSNTFGEASDGWGGTDTLVNVRAVYGSIHDDTITGGDQNDLIQGWYGNNSIDGGAGLDTALYWCSKAAATWTPNNDGSWTVTTPFGTDTLRNVETLQFKDGTAQLPHAEHDFNLDNRSDLLFQDSAGNLRLWTMNGATVTGDYAVAGTPAGTYKAVATGDFNKDGSTDILLVDAGNNLALWTMGFTAAGPVVASKTVIAALAAGTTVKNAGDYSSDGAADALLQSSNRTVSLLGSADGTTYNKTDVTVLSSTWSPAGYADFDGNHTNDILWKDNAGNLNLWYFGAGGIAGREFLTKLSGTWSVAGVGDLNGDLKADLLLVDGSGNLKVKTMNGSAITGEASLGALPIGWSIAQILDVDGDGKADIISKHIVGATTEWDVTYAAESIAAGTFTTHALGALASNAGWQLV